MQKMRVTTEQRQRIVRGAMRHASALMVARFDLHEWKSNEMRNLALHSIDLMASIEVVASQLLVIDPSAIPVAAKKGAWPPAPATANHRCAIT
jgi:hypothetical protein